MTDPAISDGVVVRVSGAAKRFSHTPAKARRPGTRDVILAMFGREPSSTPGALRPDEFWAVRDVTFDLHRGEALGIVGLNGAGKSTLLKLLLGRLQPDAGMVRVYGRAGGLIELGAGFHPELSGRRNIYISASLLGVREADVESRIGEIVEFADIGEFIDSPVKTYSSGMKVRLGFSVAVHFVPDVVICDEVLAVGDFEFRQKCLQRIKEIRRTRSVILVSHSSADITLFCNRAMLLHRGECILIDTPERVLRAYTVCTTHISADEVRRRAEKTLRATAAAKPAPAKAVAARTAVPSKLEQSVLPPCPRSVSGNNRSGYAPLDGSPSPSSMVFDDSNQPTETELLDRESETKLFGPTYWNRSAVAGVSLAWSFERNEKGFYVISGEPLCVQITFELCQPIERFRIGFPIFSEAGQMILGPDSRNSPDAQTIGQPGKYRIDMCLDPLPLNSGRFRPAISICDDPAQIFRRLLPYFSVFNPGHEFGVAKCFSTWTLSNTIHLPTIERFPE